MKSVMLLCVVGTLLVSGCMSERVTTNAATGGSSAGGKESGYEYKVARGDTLSKIAKAYRDQGIKVTADQILKANPGLDPKIKVGQKIFIPASAQGQGASAVLPTRPPTMPTTLPLPAEPATPF